MSQFTLYKISTGYEKFDESFTINALQYVNEDLKSACSLLNMYRPYSKTGVDFQMKQLIEHHFPHIVQAWFDPIFELNQDYLKENADLFFLRQTRTFKKQNPLTMDEIEELIENKDKINWSNINKLCERLFSSDIKSALECLCLKEKLIKEFKSPIDTDLKGVDLSAGDLLLSYITFLYKHDIITFTNLDLNKKVCRLVQGVLIFDKDETTGYDYELKMYKNDDNYNQFLKDQYDNRVKDSISKTDLKKDLKKDFKVNDEVSPKLSVETDLEKKLGYMLKTNYSKDKAVVSAIEKDNSLSTVENLISRAPIDSLKVLVRRILHNVHPFEDRDLLDDEKSKLNFLILRSYPTICKEISNDKYMLEPRKARFLKNREKISEFKFVRPMKLKTEAILKTTTRNENLISFFKSNGPVSTKGDGLCFISAIQISAKNQYGLDLNKSELHNLLIKKTGKQEWYYNDDYFAIKDLIGHPLAIVRKVTMTVHIFDFNDIIGKEPIIIHHDKNHFSGFGLDSLISYKLMFDYDILPEQVDKLEVKSDEYISKKIPTPPPMPLNTIAQSSLVSQIKPSPNNKSDKDKFDWFEDVLQDMDEQYNNLTSSDSEKEDTPIESNNEDEDDNNDSEDDISNSDNNDLFEAEMIDCCYTPHTLNISNLSFWINYYEQFKDTLPSSDCLYNGLELAKQTLDVLDSANKLPGKVGEIIKCVSKFRHDTFAYFFMQNSLGVEKEFGTDYKFPIKMIKDRTPDYIEIKDKLLTIYEFSVVVNLSRAYYQKGFDKYDSKYKNEIKMLEDNGYLCKYHPIFLITSQSVEENRERWRSQGFECDDVLMKNIETIIDSIDNSKIYLYSFMFDNKYFSVGEEHVQPKLNNWAFKTCFINKSRFFQSYQILRNFKFDNGFYNLNFGKMLKILSTKNNSGIPGAELINLQTSEWDFFKKFEENFKGKEKTYLCCKEDVQVEIGFETHHGSRSLESPDWGWLINQKKEDNFTISDFNLFVQNLTKIDSGGLNTKLSLNDVETSVSIYENSRKKWLVENLENHPPIYNNPRRSFYNMLDVGNTSIIDYGKPLFEIIPDLSNSFKAIFNLIDKAQFTKEPIEITDDMKDNYKTASGNLYSFLKENNLQNASFKKARAELGIDKQEEFKKLQSDLRDSQIKYMKNMKKNNRGLININSDLKKLIKEDMNWGNDSCYKLAMNPRSNLEDLQNIFFSKAPFFEDCVSIPQDIDIPFFSRLKDMCVKDINRNSTEINQLMVFNWLKFHSRLSYTLLASSNRSFNKNYVMVDNLGLQNVMLIVKGGSKLATTRKSKIFKLVYPCIDQSIDWMQTKNISKQKHITFDETPWMQLTQAELMDGLCLPVKFSLNYNYLRTKYDPETTQSCLFMPTALALSNRRSMEKNLHNMRYLIVNAMGTHSQVGKMLEEFSKPAYNNLELLIYNNLGKNYTNYFKSIQEWLKLESNEEAGFKQRIQHPYMDRRVSNIDDLTYIIYSTYMMTKGNYNQTLEQILNMEGIMDTHRYFHDNIDKLKVQNHFTNRDDLYSNDFNYSTTASYAVGKILSCELKNKHATNNLHISYNRIINSPVDNMANNRGLRSKGKDFFGHKGYFVVYKKLYESKLEEITLILETNDWADCNKKLRKLNKTFLSEQSDNKLEKVIFHVVDKLQRGGGREIYVMDYTTKLYQNTLEKMFKTICEFIENEIITVPSNKRNQIIYRQNFEFRDEKYTTYYLSYDCRKWAPRCNPEKYLVMLDAMRDVLPSDFIEDCEFYFEKHRNKEIHTRSHIIERYLKKNPQDKKYFTVDEEKGSAFFVMNYSFVMGIFNMLSSLYHAGAQLLCKYIIEKKNYMKMIPCTFEMKAHSDDSAGRISYLFKDTDDLISEDVQLYQNLQKSCNHLMSVKKCSTSKNYFELLSTLFINHEFLPVLPKFLSNFSSVFSGKGISIDMKNTISKSIELMMNGATASVCFMSQILISNFYRNFYRVQTDLTIPALGGTAMSWPTLYLAFGSAADEIRVSICSPDLYKRVINYALDNLDFDLENGTVNLKMSNKIRLPKAYKDFKNLVKLPEFPDNEWFFQNNKTRHSVLNVFWFRAMLENKDFSVSLLNINEARRFYDTLYMASGDNVMMKFGNTSINKLLLNILGYNKSDNKYFDYMKKLYSTMIDFYEAVDNQDDFDITNKPNLTLKPCTLSINNFATMPINDFNPMVLATQLCRPELTKYLYTTTYYGAELKSFKQFLNDIGVPNDIKLTKSFLDFSQKFGSYTMSIYCDVPRNKRSFINDSGLFDLICNGFSNKLSIKPNKTFNRKINMFEVDFEKNIIDRVGLSYLHSIVKNVYDDNLKFTPVLFKGKEVALKDIPDLDTSDLGSGHQFINLIGQFEKKKINLNTYNNWAYWEERQANINGTWVGKGVLICKCYGKYMKIYCKNDIIMHIECSANDELRFDKASTDYFKLILMENGLRFNTVVGRTTDNKYFGYNKEGLLGIHHANDILFGCINFPGFERKDYDNVYHIYDQGNHIIEKLSSNFKLMTIDSILINEKGPEVFKLINWDNIEEKTQSTILNNILSGNWGTLPNIKYSKEELVCKIRNTELYKLIYEKVIKNKNKLANVFWGDILTNIINQEDYMPIMFENLGLSDMQKLLPQEKKDTIMLYRYYDIQSDKLFQLNKILSSTQNEAQKAQVLIEILQELKDDSGLAQLPEIGNPDNFAIWKYTNDISISIWYSAAANLASALYSGLRILNSRSQAKINNRFNTQVTERLLLDCLIGLQNEESELATNFKMLSFRQMVVHELLDEIFHQKLPFIEFSRKLRNTELSGLPRHPRFVSDWHTILANFFKKFRLSDIDYDYYPATLKIKHKLTKGYKKINFCKKPFGMLFNIIYKNDLPYDKYTHSLNEIINFTSAVEDFNKDVEIVEDYADDIEEEFDHVRNKESSSIQRTFNDNLTSVEPGKSFCSQYFLPMKTVYHKRLADGRVEYYYNLNEDIAKNLDLKKQSLKFERECQKKYIRFYNDNYVFDVMNLGIEKINIDLNYEIEAKSIMTKFELYNPSSYNDDLVVKLTEKYNLKEKHVEELKTIVFSKRTPLIKASFIRSLIRSKINKKTNFSSMITDALNSLNLQNTNDIELIKENNLKNLYASVKNKDNLIYKNTSLKIEYRQLSTLFEKFSHLMVGGDIKLSKLRVDNYKTNLKMMINHFKQKKKPEETSFLRVLYHFIDSIVIGTTNNNGEEFEDFIHTYISSFKIEESDEEDISEIDEPVSDIKNFKIVFDK
jgi:hypothetical protein